MSMGSKYRVEEIVPYLRLATWNSERATFYSLRQNRHQCLAFASSWLGGRASWLMLWVSWATWPSDHFQICHQRLVLRKLGLIAYNNKSIPTTSKTTLMTLMLCVFIIMASGPNCNHISQPPTIANIALTSKLIEIILLLP
jgi:hypothetical protein